MSGPAHHGCGSGRDRRHPRSLHARRLCGRISSGLIMELIVLVGITFIAATVNGALGYGFSSITVPVALLFYTNRILNPALVLVEMVINGYVLFINRGSVPAVWKRV